MRAFLLITIHAALTLIAFFAAAAWALSLADSGVSATPSGLVALDFVFQVLAFPILLGIFFLENHFPLVAEWNQHSALIMVALAVVNSCCVFLLSRIGSKGDSIKGLIITDCQSL